jgi:hypothetical protein
LKGARNHAAEELTRCLARLIKVALRALCEPKRVLAPLVEAFRVLSVLKRELYD